MTKENDVVSVQTDNAELVAVTRLDFEAFFERAFREINPNTPYTPNWHVSALAYQFDRCRRGEVTRLAIVIPPNGGAIRVFTRAQSEYQDNMFKLRHPLGGRFPQQDTKDRWFALVSRSIPTF